jgi:transcriptional regulator with XRE-family HTH domain
MDKRRKPLMPHEQLLLRLQVETMILEHPEYSVPRLLREVRKTLRLTIAEMARIGGLSVPALKNIESGKNSPSLATVEGLLKPLGLRLCVIQAGRAEAFDDQEAKSEALRTDCVANGRQT